MRALLLVASLLLVLGASACGSKTSAETTVSPDAVQLAASRTTDAGSYKADMTASMEVSGQSVEMNGTGEFDASDQRGRMSFTTSVAGQDLDMEMVYALPAVYMHYPAGLLPGLSEERPWVKLDLEKLGRQEGLDFGQLMQAGQSDPTQGLQYLKGADDIQAAGDEEVRGVQTTHYTGVVDLRALAEEDPAMKESVDQLIAQTGITRIPVDVWIDEDGLVRRLRQTMHGAASGQGLPLDVTTTTELYDFGTDVSVEEPPADQVIDFQDLLGQS
jgi:LppX/LprAFG-like lipoprotein